MTTGNRCRHEMVDVRESRATARFEIRADKDDDTIVLTGYASTFEPYELYGGPANFGWIEQIDPGAFTKTLAEGPDLHLLINHEGMPLARTKSGTLDLSVDGRGLKVVARLSRNDPDVQRLEPKMRRGDMDEMSFAFRAKKQTWSAAPGFDDPMTHRLITEITLHKGDVSIVNFGANPTTTAEMLAASRKKKGNGMRRTLSVAEAASISSVEAGQSAARVRSAGKALSLREAEVIIAADSKALTVSEADAVSEAGAHQALDGLLLGDRIVARAEEILDGCRAAPAQFQPFHGRGNSMTGATTVLPNYRAMCDAYDEFKAQQRRAEALAELDRQRDEIVNSRPSNWRGPNTIDSIRARRDMTKKW